MRLGPPGLGRVCCKTACNMKRYMAGVVNSVTAVKQIFTVQRCLVMWTVEKFLFYANCSVVTLSYFWGLTKKINIVKTFISLFKLLGWFTCEKVQIFNVISTMSPKSFLVLNKLSSHAYQGCIYLFKNTVKTELRVFIYIHNKNTQYTHMYYVNKLLFWID